VLAGVDVFSAAGFSAGFSAGAESFFAALSPPLLSDSRAFFLDSEG